MPNPLFHALLLARHRLGSREVLKHATRAQIYSQIEATPGISTGILQHRVNIPLGTFHHHLYLLKREGLVEAVAVGRRTLLFPQYVGDRAEATARAALGGDTARRLAREILERPGQSAGALAARLGRSTGTTYYHLRRLVQAGLVRSHSPLSRFDLRPTQLLERMAAQGVI